MSGVFQNMSGSPYRRTTPSTNAEIAPSLGRNLAACGRGRCAPPRAPCRSLPRTEFEPRRTQLDVSISKLFAVGSRTQLRANLDIYNVFNNSAVLEPNNNYGAVWRQPAPAVGGAFSGGLVDGRLLQVGGQLTF